jgi:hypothetical protein
LVNSNSLWYGARQAALAGGQLLFSPRPSLKPVKERTDNRTRKNVALLNARTLQVRLFAATGFPLPVT